jgi:hypothetical protein
MIFIVVILMIYFICITNDCSTSIKEDFDSVRRNKQTSDIERITGVVNTNCNRSSYPSKLCKCNVFYDKQLDDTTFMYNGEKLIDYHSKIYSDEPCSNTQIIRCRDI